MCWQNDWIVFIADCRVHLPWPKSRSDGKYGNFPLVWNIPRCSSMRQSRCLCSACLLSVCLSAIYFDGRTLLSLGVEQSSHHLIAIQKWLMQIRQTNKSMSIHLHGARRNAANELSVEFGHGRQFRARRCMGKAQWNFRLSESDEMNWRHSIDVLLSKGFACKYFKHLVKHRWIDGDAVNLFACLHESLCCFRMSSIHPTLQIGFVVTHTQPIPRNMSQNMAHIWWAMYRSSFSPFSFAPSVIRDGVTHFKHGLD